MFRTDFFRALSALTQFNLGGIDNGGNRFYVLLTTEEQDMSKKHNPEFIKVVLEHTKLDELTGKLSFTNLYVSSALNFGWNGGIISVPYTHVVWLAKHGRWPEEGKVLDHINDDPTDQRPVNLQEVSPESNQKKRRGRIVFRSYGKGKYGYGIGVFHDKRDDRYYVTRNLSRGYGSGDLKTKNHSIGGFNSLEEAEAKIASYIAEIERVGPAHIPVVEKNKSQTTMKLLAMRDTMLEMKEKGYTCNEIAKKTGFSWGGVHRMLNGELPK
jgi:hypothetical protein